MLQFILNGGLLGILRGYDAEKEGRPYGFPEFNEDIKEVTSSLQTVSGLLEKK